MKKFLIGLIAGVLLAGLTGLVLIFALARLGEGRPTIQDGSTLVMRLSGEVPERPPIEL
ncbi:MAG: hypothetical protein GY953_41565, partial [bacterium]|nr:hypothetical protein [bacterium]